jgi:hypothetical protein
MQWLNDSLASMWGGDGTSASATQNAAAPAPDEAQQPLQEAGMLTKVPLAAGYMTPLTTFLCEVCVPHNTEAHCVARLTSTDRAIIPGRYTIRQGCCAQSSICLRRANCCGSLTKAHGSSTIQVRADDRFLALSVLARMHGTARDTMLMAYLMQRSGGASRKHMMPRRCAAVRLKVQI